MSKVRTLYPKLEAERGIIIWYLSLTKQGRIVDPIWAAARMREEWRVRVDWHEFGNVLEIMSRTGSATRIGQGADRVSLYTIAAEQDGGIVDDYLAGVIGYHMAGFCGRVML